MSRIAGEYGETPSPGSPDFACKRFKESPEVSGESLVALAREHGIDRVRVERCSGDILRLTATCGRVPWRAFLEAALEVGCTDGES